MKWIKAGEGYVPESPEKKQWRFTETQEPALWNDIKKIAISENNSDDVEWLDESPMAGDELEEDDIVREIRVKELLDHMIKCDKELYEKILDTNGFAYYFNELAKLAKAKIRIIQPISGESNQDELWKDISFKIVCGDTISDLAKTYHLIKK